MKTLRYETFCVYVFYFSTPDTKTWSELEW